MIRKTIKINCVSGGQPSYGQTPGYPGVPSLRPQGTYPSQPIVDPQIMQQSYPGVPQGYGLPNPGMPIPGQQLPSNQGLYPNSAVYPGPGATAFPQPQPGYPPATPYPSNPGAGYPAMPVNQSNAGGWNPIN